MNDIFFEKWDRIDLFKLYQFDENSAKNLIIQKIKYMKDFWKLLRLFGINKIKVKKDDLYLISKKYEELIKNDSNELYPNFSKETSLLIYYLDKNKEDIITEHLMKEVIEKYSLSSQIIDEIYIYLLSIYNDISIKIIDYIYNYFIIKQQIKIDDRKKCIDIIKIKIIEEKFKLIFNNNIIKIKSNLLGIKIFIEEIYGEYSNDLAISIIRLIKEQYIKAEDQDYKLELLKFIFENNKLIQHSLYFINQSIKLNYPINDGEDDFLDFITLKKTNKIYNFYENIKNEAFEEILLYYFEILADDYFNDIKNNYNVSNKRDKSIKSIDIWEELLLKNNIIYLKKALDHIDNVYNNVNLVKDSLNNIGKIYSIAYVKLYIKHFAEIYRYNNDKIDLNEIIKIICYKNYNTRNVVKIFFLKNCFLYFDNYSQFNHYISNNTDFPFRDYYDKNYSSKDIYILKYPLLIMENFEENYSKNNFIFNSLKNNDFKNLEKIFLINKDLSNHSDITDLLFCLSVNNLLSYYFSEEKETCNNKIKCLKEEFRKLYSRNLIIPSMNINLLNHVFDFSNFINIIVTKMNINLKNFKQEQFEILMYSLRFVLKSSQFNKNNFYYNILASNSKEYIKNNYIIGNYPFHNIVINSYND